MSIAATGRIARTGTGRELEIVRTIRAPIGDVWASIVDPERMNRWIGTWSGEPGEGKRVTFVMTAEGSSEPEEVLIHRCDAPRLLEVETAMGEGTWRMRVELAEREEVTTIRFSQVIFEGDDTGSIGPGWEYYLDRLVATHTGEPFTEWDSYYPSQQPYWQEQDRLVRDG